MTYRIAPMGEFWQDGVFCVPSRIVQKHLKFADGNQLKVLLLLLSEGGVADAGRLSQALGISEAQVGECLEFWLQEGILLSDEALPAPEKTADEPAAASKPLEALPMPTLSPRDIVAMCSENSALADLLRSAEQILSSSLSASMQSNLVNMVTYYGLPVPVVITLLEYYKKERDAGKSISTRNLQMMAKDWANDGVATLEEASAKLQELENCEELWSEVIALCQFDFRKPTAAQKKMLLRWRSEFDKEMIFFACNTMKKYTEEALQSLKIVDNILKEWRRKGFKTPADVKAQPPAEEKKKGNKLKSKPSFDIDEIKKRAVLNDDFDF